METNQKILEIVKKAILEVNAIEPSRDGQNMTMEDFRYKQLDFCLNEALIAAQCIADVPEYLRAKSTY
jgi:hypothetical protein